ncbi:MAG: ATP-dependent RNA helicase HrpA [Pseudomonadales bacterium]|nr:ATP-dependent RNA helicase HrpA [Pseudomonadales bacterium]
MLNSLKQELDQCQHGDKFRLARKIRELEKAQLPKSENQSRVKKIAAEINASKAACSKRSESIPQEIHFPDELPISAKTEEIERLLLKHQVLVIAGDTGSGKTTQIPKICLKAGLGRKGLIGHTQPRRLAAFSVANRIAEELNTELGQGVGYQIRFKETISDSSYLKLMTDGILLAEIQNDRFLNKYDIIIIDEAHERSLNIDFLLGYLKQLLKKRTELKLIITSATIDVEKFARHFSDAPIVSVSGRTYPVDVLYQPIGASNDEVEDQDQIDGIIQALNTIVEEDQRKNSISGDTLVFLSSERDIRESAKAIRKRKFPHTDVLPLYSRLRQSEQAKIFTPHKGRRVVLATNVAETSITVPGIKYVIDTGVARISRYSIQSKVQRLPIEAVSQASADQRKGRCGRISAGICIRLYSEQDYHSRPKYTDPEIKRTNLASVILQMLALRLGDVEQFPYLEPPERKAINDGFKLLIELNAINQQRSLTATGRQMAKLPVDPKLARMLVVANSQSCLRELLIIVSALSIQDPRELSGENRQQAQERLAVYSHSDSDFLSLVQLWEDFESKRQSYSQNQLKKHCKTSFLSYMRMREWREVHRQLLVTCQQLGYRLNREAGSYEAIHKSIIAGSLNQIASKFDARVYLGTRNRKFSIFSSSVVAKGKSKWIVTGELIETSQTFASMAAKIQPQWVESMALHLVKREYFDPHWSKKTQAVMAYEKVQLYGLTIIEKTLVNYADFDIDKARSLFINEGLVAGELSSNLKFIGANQQFLESLAKEEEKIRRPDLYVGERDIAKFYEERIPEDICSTQKLESWIGHASEVEKQALLMTREKLLSNESTHDRIASYPDHTPVLKNRLSIDYVFDPGSSRDGATIQIPQKILNQIEQADIDWAVPGIIREKCVTLLKGLPKSIRKKLIPISGLVDEIIPGMSSSDGELVASLISQVARHKSVRLSATDFAAIELPGHLRIKIEVTDEIGNEVGFAEDLAKLKADLLSSDSQQEKVQRDDILHEIQQRGLKDWDIDNLPTQVEIGEDLVLIRYPAFVDCEDSVAIELFADQEEANSWHLQGLIRLFMLRSVAQRNLLRKRFAQFLKDYALLIPPHLKESVDDATSQAYVVAFDLENVKPKNKQEFSNQLNQGKSKLHSAGERIADILAQTLKTRFEILKQLSNYQSNELDYFVRDVEQQLGNLMTEKLFSDASIEWLEQYPRYLNAIAARLDKAPHLGEKDKELTEELDNYWRKYEDLIQQREIKRTQEIIHFRWMLEEYRVSLFAQSLGTKIPVSVKRLDKQLERIKS